MTTHHGSEPQHESEHENISPPQNIKVKYVALAATVGVLVVLTIMVSTDAWRRASVHAFREQRLEAHPSVMDPVIKERVDAQRANLTREGQWLNSQQTRARIPIETAKQLIVQRYRTQATETAQDDAAVPDDAG